MSRVMRRRLGQAAVEGLLSIPVLLVVFMIGFELWGLAWDAQYVGIRSRYQVLAAEDAHMAAGTDAADCQTMTRTASVVFPADQLPLIGGAQSPIPVKSQAVIICGGSPP